VGLRAPRAGRALQRGRRARVARPVPARLVLLTPGAGTGRDLQPSPRRGRGRLPRQEVWTQAGRSLRPARVRRGPDAAPSPMVRGTRFGPSRDRVMSRRDLGMSVRRPGRATLGSGARRSRGLGRIASRAVVLWLSKTSTRPGVCPPGATRAPLEAASSVGSRGRSQLSCPSSVVCSARSRAGWLTIAHCPFCTTPRVSPATGRVAPAVSLRAVKGKTRGEAVGHTGWRSIFTTGPVG